MPAGYNQAIEAANLLVEAAKKLKSDPSSVEGSSMMLRGAQGTLEGTLRVLLVWDMGEVDRIVSTARWALDRVSLVEASRSMRGLVVCFRVS